MVADATTPEEEIELVRREALYRFYMAGYLMVEADNAPTRGAHDLLTRGSLAMKVQAEVLADAVQAGENYVRHHR